MLLLLLPSQLLLLVLCVQPYVTAQQQSGSSSLINASPTPTSTPLPTSTSYTTYTSIFATTFTPGQPRPSGSRPNQSVFLATTTVTSALFTSISSTSLPLPSSTSTVVAPSPSTYQQTGLPLHTIIDPAFGVLGAVLILTGLTLAFIGHRSRWLLCLISGFYTFALVTLCVILRVGVARSLDDPDKTLKGIYLLACVIAGGIGGAAFVIFRQGGLLVSSSLGGFVCALYLQSFKSNGIIPPIGLRYILYLGLATLAFSLACHSRLQSYVLIFSSAVTGATAVVLGIDCFTRANLKEFYARNLGFDDLFERKYPEEFRQHHWFLSTASIIELGVIGGLTLMAISFQGKMWAEFRASLQMMRHDDEERRLQAKAKRAAKKILASAQKDLRDWEERHGYRKTVTRPDMQDNGYVVQNIPSSDMPDYQPKGSVISLLPINAGQSDTPAIEYTPAITYEPTLAESVGLLNSPMSGSTAHPRPYDTTWEKHGDVPLTTEQQTLLEEIATIRKSIDVLRSASPGTALEVSSDTQEVGKRASSASLLRKSREELSARTPSPWLTNERTRSQSISTRMPRVDPDLFSGSDKMSPMMRSSSPRGSSFIDDPPRPSSVMLPKAEMPSSEGRARAGSDSRVLESIARSPKSRAAEGDGRRSMKSPVAASQRRMSDITASPSEQSRRANRIIVETKEEAAARYAKSINREKPRGKSQSRKSMEPSILVEYTKKSTMMSLGELQARHESRLKAMQRPASERAQEEASLIKAKEDWTRRSLLEKKRWESIEKEQKRELLPVEKEERPRQSSRSKSLASGLTPPPAAVTASTSL